VNGSEQKDEDCCAIFPRRFGNKHSAVAIDIPIQGLRMLGDVPLGEDTAFTPFRGSVSAFGCLRGDSDCHCGQYGRE